MTHAKARHHVKRTFNRIDRGGMDMNIQMEAISFLAS
jgi:hypothetical protein